MYKTIQQEEEMELIVFIKLFPNNTPATVVTNISTYSTIFKTAALNTDKALINAGLHKNIRNYERKKGYSENRT
jgi:hypothetical protein